MLTWLNLLLLLWFVSGCETATIKKGQKGGNVTLPCNKYKDSAIFRITMIKIKNGKIDSERVCDNKNCSEQEKSGIILKNLSFNDAGRYNLTVHYDNGQTVLKPQTTEYQLQIHDEITVKIGDKLNLDVLFPNVKEVRHQTESSSEINIWKRGHEVQNNRLTVRDRTLTINDFTASDAGSYIVLDSEGNFLITVTVRESGSAGEHKAPKPPTPKHWSLPKKLSVFFVIWVVMVLLAILIVFLFARWMN